MLVDCEGKNTDAEMRETTGNHQDNRSSQESLQIRKYDFKDEHFLLALIIM